MPIQHTSRQQGSDRTLALDDARVAEVMSRGVISCSPETGLKTVARLMVTNHVHAVVVSHSEVRPDHGERLTWALITALDLVAAALPGVETTKAADLASSEIVTVE